MRMINADDLEKALREAGLAEVIKDCSKYTSAWGVPIVDAEPVRCGHWIYENHNYSCSVCGSKRRNDHLEIFMGDYKYCPICGSWNGSIVMVAHLEKEEET